MRVLLIEDDATLGRALQEFLTNQGYAVDWLADGQRALLAIKNYNYDLLVLDLNLPDMDGLDVLRAIRAEGKPIGVLVLTARDALTDRVEGLDAGADDYLSKPFELDELAARIRAFARRQLSMMSPVIEFGTVQLDTVHREVRIEGQLLALSVRELSVLEILLSRAGKIVTKQQITHALSAMDADFSDNAVEVYIYRLRKRLERSEVSIKTMRGFGYMLEIE
jgi:two-component system, OmpR family, response regulator